MFLHKSTPKDSHLHTQNMPKKRWGVKGRSNKWNIYLKYLEREVYVSKLEPTAPICLANRNHTHYPSCHCTILGSSLGAYTCLSKDFEFILTPFFLSSHIYIYIYIYTQNCRQNCFGLLGLISAVQRLGKGWHKCEHLCPPWCSTLMGEKTPCHARVVFISNNNLLKRSLNNNNNLLNRFFYWLYRGIQFLHESMG